MSEEMLGVLGFLTRFPVGRKARIEDIARDSYLFPVAGAIIGVSVAVFACIISELSSDCTLNAALTLLFLYSITGLMHLDGLADFADGVFASGSVEEKIKAMKDVNIGISGIFAVVFVLLIDILAINSMLNSTLASSFASEFASESAFTSSNYVIKSRLSHFNVASLFQFFITSEISAKLCMNTCMILAHSGWKGGAGGKKRTRKGMGAYFIENFSYWKYLAALSLALIISVTISLPLLHSFAFYRAFLVLVGVAVAFFVYLIAVKNFGAVSGDVFGASNEIARCVCFVTFAFLSLHS